MERKCRAEEQREGIREEEREGGEGDVIVEIMGMWWMWRSKKAESRVGGDRREVQDVEGGGESHTLRYLCGNLACTKD